MLRGWWSRSVVGWSRTLTWNWWTGLLALVVSLPLAAWVLSQTRWRAAEDLELIPLGADAERISDLWIAPDDRLVATFESGSILRIKWWQLRGRLAGPQQATIDFAHELGNDEPLVLGNSFAQARRAAPLDGRAAVVPYAVSDDSSRIAWIWNGEAWIGDLSPGKFRRLDTKVSFPVDPGPAVALAFAGEDRLTVIHAARPGVGKVKVYGLRGERSLVTHHLRGERWAIWTRGSIHVILTIPLRQVWTLETRTLHQQEHPVSSDSQVLSLLSAGVPVQGTREGMVVEVVPRGQGRAITISPMKPIRALAPFGEERLVAAADGVGIQLVSEFRDTYRLASAPRGITFLTVGRRVLAYTAGNTLGVMRLTRRPELTEFGKWLLALMFSLLGFLGFWRPILYEWQKGRRAQRPVHDSRNGDSPAPSGPVTPTAPSTNA